ncbi:phosphodiester glycosidase family protein [Phormidesmis sp. 146-12]
MRKVWQIGLVLVGLSLSIAVVFRSLFPSAQIPISVSSSVPQTIQYESRLLSHSVVHIVKIPLQNQFEVMPVLSNATETIEQFARREGAIAVINGGYFDPQNQQSTSYVVVNGQVVADPKQNDRLMENPTLKPYLERILNRSEFRRYQCDQTIRYAFALHRDPVPLGCRLESSLGGGPRLLPKLTDEEEAFTDSQNGRDPIGINQRNARSAIGLTDTTIIWIMVAQTKPSDGMSLIELANLMKSLGVKTAMNLDGGSSSALYYRGKTINGKVDETGNRVKRPLAGNSKRPVKSALIIKQK